jgi:hypothetical protein
MKKFDAALCRIVRYQTIEYLANLKYSFGCHGALEQSIDEKPRVENLLTLSL